MFGEKAVALVKEEHRTPSEQLQPLNEDLIRQVLQYGIRLLQLNLIGILYQKLIEISWVER